MNTHTQFRRHKDREKISLQESLLRTGKRSFRRICSENLSRESSARYRPGDNGSVVQTASRPKPAPVYPADTFYRGNLDLSETEQIRRADTQSRYGTDKDAVSESQGRDRASEILMCHPAKDPACSRGMWSPLCAAL